MERLPLNTEPHTAAKGSLQDQYVQLTRGGVDTPDPTGFFVRAKTSSLTGFKMVTPPWDWSGLHHREVLARVLRWTFHAVHTCTSVNCQLRRPGGTCTKNEHPTSISVINRKPDARGETNATRGQAQNSSRLHSILNLSGTGLNLAKVRMVTPSVRLASRESDRFSWREKEAPVPLREMADRSCPRLLSTAMGVISLALSQIYRFW